MGEHDGLFIEWGGAVCDCSVERYALEPIVEAIVNGEWSGPEAEAALEKDELLAKMVQLRKEAAAPVAERSR